MKRPNLPNLKPSPGLLLLFVGVLSAAGCDEPLEPHDAFRDGGDGPSGEGTWPPTGGTLNTAWLGNTLLMRLVLPNYANNRGVGDAPLESVELFLGGKYEPVASIDADGGELVVWQGGVARRGAEQLGSRWWLKKAKGEYLSIDHFSETDGRFGYQFGYHHGSDPFIEPNVCEPDEDGDRWAYVVGDVSVDISDGSIEPDVGTLLIACSSGALGKAITWGFTPWAGAPAGDLDLYRTGVRTVRADYCGDGSSFTEDGTLIQVSNALAGQSFSDPTAPTEAVFGPDGALCLSNMRIGGIPPCPIPACLLTPGGEPIHAHGSNAWTKLAP